MMSLKSKRKLLEAVRSRYLKASKSEKQKMLDEFTPVTGYHQKHAIRVLKNKVQSQNHLNGKNKTYKTIYGGEVAQALEQIWEIAEKQIKSLPFWKVSMLIYGTMSISFSHLSNGSVRNVSTIKPSNGMIQQGHLTSASLNARIFLGNPKRSF
jgi:hypothetical protein